LLIAAPAFAIQPFPASFRSQEIKTNGTTLYVRVGGSGPAVVMLHGFADTGDMWAPPAAVLAQNHTVVVPDLRGMGLSALPDTGYTKKNQAGDIADIMDALKIQTADLVTHDIGNMVGLCAGGAVPGPYHQMGGDRRAAAGNWQLGRDQAKPDAKHCSSKSPGASPVGLNFRGFLLF
jgi:pimeloyl-ACP methyl ester carboxylesterase